MVESPSPTVAIADTQLTLACNVYSLLHYVPQEYFSRPVRAELVKRAMSGDVQICRVLEDAKAQKIKTRNDRDRGKTLMEESDDRVPAKELEKWFRRLTFVRVFLQRMGQFLGTPSHSVSFVALLCIMLMQNMYKDFLDLRQSSAQPSTVLSFPIKGTHKCYPRFDTITRCVRSEVLLLYMLTMIPTSGASCAHGNRRQQHPSLVSYLRL